MQCRTIDKIDPETGKKTYKDKKVFDAHEDAIAACKKLNMKPNRTHKLVSYKCTKCHKYHIGRNGKKITEKYIRQNTIKASDTTPKVGLKIIGKIDLDGRV